MFMLNEKNLKALLSSWTSRAEVYAPQLNDGQVMLLAYEENSFTMDYINFAFPVKEYLFKQREILFNWVNNVGNISVGTPDISAKNSRIYFGVRPCDAYGIKYMDKFFLEGYKDEFYENYRNSAIIVSVNCTQAGKNCFCSSMGIGPFASDGYDILFTPLKEGYLIEAGTDKGQELLDSSIGFLVRVDENVLEEKETALAAALETFTTAINTDNMNSLLKENYNNPIWQNLSRECISCTGCTSLCPTCTCFNVVEENTNNCSGCRARYWDSCQSDSFTRNAKNHNPRSSTARLRYRIYDKLKYIEDKFNMKGCTGCGRCINVCPASINIVEIINRLADSKLTEEGSGVK